MSTISPTDFDSLEIQQQYNDINNRWDLAAETDWDNENSSARLFERSRIKALAGSMFSLDLISPIPSINTQSQTARGSWSSNETYPDAPCSSGHTQIKKQPDLFTTAP
ncbi:hypothetical protein PAMP_006913 [Pampus punctatissimus]